MRNRGAAVKDITDLRAEAYAALAEWGALPADGPTRTLRAKVEAGRRVVRALRALLDEEEGR